MLPPINFKVHPKMAEIMEEKRRRREMLLQAREKEGEELGVLREGRKEYKQENKRAISRKKEQIYEKKQVQHDLIREEEKDRAARIAIKKLEKLIELYPERSEFFEMLKENYLRTKDSKDEQFREKIQQIIEARMAKPKPQIRIQQKIRENNILDTNEGTCVICLTSEAHIYMVECKHLIACKDCEFILRMQKKCPLCRRHSEYCDLKEPKRKRRTSVAR